MRIVNRWGGTYDDSVENDCAEDHDIDDGS
jgi:hypothetical protein